MTTRSTNTTTTTTTPSTASAVAPTLRLILADHAGATFYAFHFFAADGLATNHLADDLPARTAAAVAARAVTAAYDAARYTFAAASGGRGRGQTAAAAAAIFAGELFGFAAGGRVALRGDRLLAHIAAVRGLLFGGGRCRLLIVQAIAAGIRPADMFAHGQTLISSWLFRPLFRLVEWFTETIHFLAAGIRVAFRRNAGASRTAIAAADQLRAAGVWRADAQFLHRRFGLDGVAAFLASFAGALLTRRRRRRTDFGFPGLVAIAAALGAFTNGTRSAIASVLFAG